MAYLPVESVSEDGVPTLSTEALAWVDPPAVFLPQGAKFRLTHQRLAEGGQTTVTLIGYIVF